MPQSLSCLQRVPEGYPDGAWTIPSVRKRPDSVWAIPGCQRPIAAALFPDTHSCGGEERRRFRQCAIILLSTHESIWTEQSVNSVDQELSSPIASEVEVRRLQEENARLRCLLIAHSIPIPEAGQPTLHLPQTLNAAPEARKPGVATAEQRIALFRGLFRGREDIYAIRWENNDGRSGYMPKADRDWKSYLSAKDEDRKKVDRLTRTYWPLTDDVIHRHLVGEQIDLLGLFRGGL